jgi:predicted nucleotidyltransferase
VGSLIEDRFALHSDVDFLVERCPRQLKYSIESVVESVMLDIPFDVIYQDEVETEAV